MNYEDTIKRSEVEQSEKWHDIINKVPSLKFKESWNVKVIPPFAGAVARFTINDDDDTQICSIYLDWFDRLGIYGEPYYELYPFDDDVKRYSLKETEELLSDIDYIFKQATG